MSQKTISIREIEGIESEVLWMIDKLDGIQRHFPVSPPWNVANVARQAVQGLGQELLNLKTGAVNSVTVVSS